MSKDALDRQHVPELDGVRGLAILLVLLHHMWCVRTSTPIDGAVHSIIGLGWFGVDLFFVLSGYLITTILLQTKSAPHYFRNFYVRRVLRIFPLYYVILVVSLFVLPQLLPPDKAARFGTVAGDEGYYWLFASNFAIAGFGGPRHGVLDVTWSLAIEEQFYLFWPLVVALCSPRRLLQLCAGLIVLSLGTRIALFAGSSYNNFSIYVLTPCRLDGLAMGAALAVAAREPGLLQRYRRPATLVFWVLLAVVIAVPILEDQLWPDPFGAGLGLNDVFLVVGLTLLGAFFGAMLLLVITAPPGGKLRRFFSSRLLRLFGVYSYGLYLIHLPLRAFVRDRILGPHTLPSRWHFPTLGGSELPGQLVFYVVAIALSLGVAMVSFHLFEKPFLSLKRYFVTARTDRH